MTIKGAEQTFAVATTAFTLPVPAWLAVGDHFTAHLVHTGASTTIGSSAGASTLPPGVTQVAYFSDGTSNAQGAWFSCVADGAAELAFVLGAARVGAGFTMYEAEQTGPVVVSSRTARALSGSEPNPPAVTPAGAGYRVFGCTLYNRAVDVVAYPDGFTPAWKLRPGLLSSVSVGSAGAVITGPDPAAEVDPGPFTLDQSAQYGQVAYTITVPVETGPSVPRPPLIGEPVSTAETEVTVPYTDGNPPDGRTINRTRLTITPV